MNKSEKTLLAFIAGAAAGAVAGLLLAPEAGEETRRKLSQKAGDLAGDLEHTWETNSKKFKELTDSALAEVEKYSKQVSSKS